MGFAHLPYGGKVSFIAEQKFHDLENLKFRLLKLCQTFFSLYCILFRNTKNGATKCSASRVLLILMTEIYTWPFITATTDSWVVCSFMEYLDQANKGQNEFPCLLNLMCC